MDTLPSEILDTQVSGVNLMPGSLRDQIGGDAVLLVFLRHFGCIFCRETVADLREAAERDPSFPRVIFFFQGTPTEGRAFLRRYWRDARAVADPEGHFYAAFEIGRASWMQALGPRVLLAGRRAKAKGHELGERSGDIWRMPGVFLVEGDRVMWKQVFRHSAEELDLGAVPRPAAVSV